VPWRLGSRVLPADVGVDPAPTAEDIWNRNLAVVAQELQRTAVE
jgi:hypothetical protein